MSTMRNMVSDVRGMHKILSTDAMITNRVIASEITNISLLLIKRETNLRKLWATDTLFTTIPCLEMIEVPISECSAFQSNETIARTKYKLPKIAEGNYQYVIQGVYSINALGGKGVKLKEISINRYMNLLNLKSKKSESYFWVSDDYIYCTNSDVELLRIAALFERPLPNDILYPECACGTNGVDVKEYCKNPLDREFYLPGYLRKQVLELTSKSLRETYFNIQSDISSEGIDGQAKNSSPSS
jgi:hypothetical protein